MARDGFATLYMDKLERLHGLYRGPDHEDEMVGLLPFCTFALNPRAASIDTPLHAYLPYRHVDHMHPDAVIAIAATRNSRAVTREIYGDEIGWLPWRRPGFELGLMLSRFAAEHPNAKGVVLESHGLFTWGDDAKSCYETTLRIINTAIAWFERQDSRGPVFGGAVTTSLPAERRGAIAAQLMPEIRARIGTGERKVGHFDDSAAVLDFVNAARLRELAALGTSCPDHFLRTKIRPLVLDFDPAAGTPETLVDGLDRAIAAYRADYAGYYERCKHPDSPAMRDPNAVVYLVPGVGMITFARDKATARIAGEFYVNAINVMRGASGVDTYVGLPEQEAFDIEYWLLEEAKLQRMPKPKSLAGQVALVTGGAGGIGRAIATKMLAEGACVVLADIDEEALSRVGAELAAGFGRDQVRTARLDVTQEGSVIAGFGQAAVDYRRGRHPRVECRHRLVRTRRDHDARDVGPQHGHPGQRLFHRIAGGVPADAAPEARRRHRVHRLEERPRGLAQCECLLHRQGGRNPPGPLPGTRRRRGGHQGQCRQPRRGAARLQDLDRRMARAAGFGL